MTLLPSLLLVATVLAVSCSTGRTAPDDDAGAPAPAGTAPEPDPESPRVRRLVVVGASDALGYGADDPDRDAWPAVLGRTLPEPATLVNLGIPGATVAEAIERELPDALAEKADVVAVWLSVNDLLAQVPAEAYERQLRSLVNALRAGGSTRVLVGNTPPLDRLPIYLACQADPSCLGGALPPPALIDAAVDAYNAAIDRVVRTERAEMVDLHAAALAARAAGTDASMIGADGFHPSTSGHRAVAEAFSTALGAA